MLGKLEEEVDAELRRKLIEWIYRLQLKSDSGEVFMKNFDVSSKNIFAKCKQAVWFSFAGNVYVFFSCFLVLVKLSLYVFSSLLFVYIIYCYFSTFPFLFPMICYLQSFTEFLDVLELLL